MPALRPPLHPARAGFTILELVTVVLIVLILAVIMMPVYSIILSRVERVNCTANLRNLHTAANLYVQDHRTWPQISIKANTEQQYATAWKSVLQPYNLDDKAWVCPTSQKRLGNPDLSDPENVRIDYFSTGFQPGPQMPFQWANQPWFAERFNEHGNGNLIVFPDGHVESMFEVLARAKPSRGKP